MSVRVACAGQSTSIRLSFSDPAIESEGFRTPTGPSGHANGPPTLKDRIEQLVGAALKLLPEAADSPDLVDLRPSVERARDAKNGDFATNVAMRLAKPLRKNPRELADALVKALPDSPIVERTEVAGPGFINFFLKPAALHDEIRSVIERGTRYGHQPMRDTPRILLEFVSANPTGPLHVGHGRHAAFGATLGNLLEAAGYRVDREYYVNDAGRQMDILAVSVLIRGLAAAGSDVSVPEGAYQGDYIIDVANGAAVPNIDATALFADLPSGDDKDKYVDALIANAKRLAGDSEFEALRRYSYESICDDIRDDLADFGVTFDRWYSEKSLTTDGQIERALAVLKERDRLYVEEGATWFRSSEYGDEKDRVVVRADGNKTYFASDIAYHFDKRRRGYDQLIDILGADHHGYVARVRAGLEAMGVDGDSLEAPLVQFVSLFEGGKKQSMGTRSGKFVTLRQLREDVGNDAARFFYVMRSNDQHLDFDLDLAKQRSNENPVYYVQYAHARVYQVFEKLNQRSYEYDEAAGLDELARLVEDEEKSLMSALTRFPEVIELAAHNRAPQHLVHYLRDLANEFHSYYQAHKIIVDDAHLRNARLTLCAAARNVFASGLNLLGVNAPRSM